MACASFMEQPVRPKIDSLDRFLTVSPHQAHNLKGEEDSNRLSIDYPTNGTNPAPATKNNDNPVASAAGFFAFKGKSARANELRKNISQYRDSKKYCCRLGN